MSYSYNEEINAARIALQSAAAEFRQFSDRSDEDIVNLFLACLNVEGILAYSPGDDHVLWERIRRKST